jgi:hypothetical protein
MTFTCNNLLYKDKQLAGDINKIMHSALHRIQELRSQNRQQDAYALWKEWERRFNKDGKEISILTIT